jgi:toxin ParE1/3/4
MTGRVTWRPRAQQDLLDQASFLADTNPEVADRFLEAAEAASRQLLTFPTLGSPRQYRNPRLVDVRAWRLKGFAKVWLFYHPTPTGIEILRVLHSARDIDAIMEEE